MAGEPISLRKLRQIQRRERSLSAVEQELDDAPAPETIELHLVRWNHAASAGALFAADRYDFDAAADVKTKRESCWIRSLTGAPPADCYFWAKLAGQHTDGLAIYTPAAPLSFKAKITSRTSVSCGSSGSGSGSGSGAGTAHAVYEYGIVGVKRILDGDGCPAWADTEFGPDISGTAFEKNGLKVSIGAIVDVTTVFRKDLSASGSGDGIASGDSCELQFDGAGLEDTTTTPVPVSDTIFRYFCATDNHFKEYLFDGEGGYDLVRDTGVLCGCCGSGGGSGGSGSGSGTGHGLCCTLPNVMCINLTLNCPGESNCKITVVNAGISNPNFWFVHDQNDCGITVGWILKHNNPDGTCDYELALDRYVITSGLATRQGIRIRGFATSITCTPLSIVFSSLSVTIFPISGNATTCSGSATVVAGTCPASSGSGGGNCPCVWQCHSLIWTELTGNPACTATPAFAQGLACNLDNEGQIVTTNADGTACAGGGGGGTVDCATCTGTTRTATFSGGTGFLFGSGGSPIAMVGVPPPCAYVSHAELTTTCGANAQVHFWCENNRLYCAITGMAAGVEAQAGGTVDNATFHLTLGPNNTLCPGQSATINVVITKP